MIDQEKPTIGSDEWVERYAERRQHARGLRGVLQIWVQRVPFWLWMVGLLAIGLVYPLLVESNYMIRIGGTIMLMGLVALGLNLVIGQAGLLDLGYIAFYGVGAYAYTYLSSDFTGLHLPAHFSVPLVGLITAGVGWLIGRLTLRLSGDYLAIVTLGFGLVFVQLTTNLTNVPLPGVAEAVDLTGGPNGITRVDGAYDLSTRGYHYLLLPALIVGMVVMHNLHHSRIGRSWRALREDELAAEMMGMPVKQLKIQAFTIGAAYAGVGGALFAGWQGAVFPTNFETAGLITLYAIVILGGVGTLAGVIAGAVIMVIMPEILRSPDLAAVFFYVLALAILFASLKPRRQVFLLLAAVGALGVGLRAAFQALWPQLLASFDGSLLAEWLVIPPNPRLWGNLAFALMLGLVLLISRLRSARARFLVLIPTLYAMVFAWETRLSQEPGATRMIFMGTLLVVLMIYRPQGMFGQERKEIV